MKKTFKKYHYSEHLSTYLVTPLLSNNRLMKAKIRWILQLKQNGRQSIYLNFKKVALWQHSYKKAAKKNFSSSTLMRKKTFYSKDARQKVVEISSEIVEQAWQRRWSFWKIPCLSGIIPTSIDIRATMLFNRKNSVLLSSLSMSGRNFDHLLLHNLSIKCFPSH